MKKQIQKTHSQMKNKFSLFQGFGTKFAYKDKTPKQTF